MLTRRDEFFMLIFTKDGDFSLLCKTELTL